MASCATATIAARVCGNLVSGGYSDWFLPSKDELNKIYLNRTTLGITDNNHWSSSQGNNNQSWSHNFSFGTQGYDYKSIQEYVRPIRVY